MVSSVRFENETMRHRFLHALFWIMFMVVFLQVMSVVGQQCELHESKYTERCCIPRTIGNGYQPVMCETDGGMVSFEPCPAHTYQFKEYSSLAFHMCERHSTCTSPYMVTLMNGTSTSNTVCQCNEGGGYYDNRSDTTSPLVYYYCILRTATVNQSSSVHQSTLVHSVPSENPADTSTSTTATYVHLIWIPCVIGLAAFIAIIVIICFRKRLKEYCCNRKTNETTDLSSIDVIHQTRMPHNGHISDPNHAAETDARLSLNFENSVAQNEYDNGSDMSENRDLENLDLRSDHDVSSSLCCRSLEC